MKTTSSVLLSAGARAEMPKAWMDHIVLGVSRLKQGVESFRRQTGVAPEFGGEHPDAGTHNALAGLGGSAYLEILAPRPGATLDKGWQRLNELDQLSPLIWAVGVADLEQATASLREAGFETTLPVAGSRTKPDGAVLRWRTSIIRKPGLEPAPFLIEWGPDVSHPSVTAPEGCSLAEFALATPDAETLRRLLTALELDVPVQQNAEPRISVRLNCSEGPVTYVGRP